MMDGFLQDVRYGLRQLAKAPGFTLLAVITLALGIGANTAMFTVVESVLLRPLAYSNSSRLVLIGVASQPGGDAAPGTTSWLNYRDIRDQAQSLSAAAGYSEDVGVVQGYDSALSTVAPGVTPNLFPMLGVTPKLGRVFSEDEGKTGGPQVAILSETLWRKAFNSDPQIIGKTIRVNARPRTVVGVMPSQVHFPESMDPDLAGGLWVPIQPTPEMLKERGYNFFKIVAQIKAGSSLAQLRTDLAGVAHRIRLGDAKTTEDIPFTADFYQRLLTGDVRPVFVALLVALGLVLLIACANVANLLIARCLARQQEFAVRVALGARRLRLLRQLLVEGGLLSLAGCTVGFLLAWAGLGALHKLPDGTIPRAGDVHLRWTVILVLAAIATLTMLLSSALPGAFAAGINPQLGLQAGSRGLGTRSVRGKVSGWLVAGEVALSVLLLISTGLLFRTLWNLEHANLGFDITRVTSFSVMPADAVGFANMGVADENNDAGPSVATRYYQPAIELIKATPGVQDAALVTAPPFSGVTMNSSFKILGISDDRQRENNTGLTAVSGAYARVMGTPVLHGRMVSDDDTAAAPFVVAVNETFARRYFPNQDAIGRQINLGGKDTGMIKPYTVAGIVGDQVEQSVSVPPRPMVMLPYQQIPTSSLFYGALLKTVVYFVVKTKSDLPVAPAARAAFKQTAPDYALDNFLTMRESLDTNHFNDRLGLYLLGTFAGMAVLMVVAGLYGVLAQLVSYRRREIGVRLALGATRRNILGMVLRQGLVLVGSGLAGGLILALAGGRLVKGFLYGVQPMDASTYAGAMLALVLVGVVAALVPARRAAAVEPIEALREE
jgi:predicted permease